ncbi:hypothetical protein FPCIR_11925 [Fusarium pseudocircinatum]|uniref:Uncharacterized protein n=1 Tax=Fusarium pseudocircinatum TaxID=56676 RepID=A0A8H5KPU0_9HYPO|nr:hypothetical protein FPCIR_11925 [Fusarium pseudocircinatum]
MVKWFRRDPAVDAIFPKLADRIDEYYCADLLDVKSVTVMVPTEKGSKEVDAEDFNKESVDIESSPEIIVTQYRRGQKAGYALLRRNRHQIDYSKFDIHVTAGTVF